MWSPALNTIYHNVNDEALKELVEIPYVRVICNGDETTHKLIVAGLAPLRIWNFDDLTSRHILNFIIKAIGFNTSTEPAWFTASIGITADVLTRPLVQEAIPPIVQQQVE